MMCVLRGDESHTLKIETHQGRVYTRANTPSQRIHLGVREERAPAQLLVTSMYGCKVSAYFHGRHHPLPLLVLPSPAAAPAAPALGAPLVPSSDRRSIPAGVAPTIVGATLLGVRVGVPAASFAARFALTSLTRCCIRAASDD